MKLRKNVKKIGMGLTLCAGLLATALPAQAIDWKAKGAWEMTMYGGDSTFGIDNSDADSFQAYQRFRIRLDAIASESLQGTLLFKITSQWGTAAGPNPNKDIGGALGTDGMGIMVRQANITWTPPDSGLTLRMGLLSLVLPAFFESGSPMFDGLGAGVVANYKFNDNFGITAFWMRPENDNFTGDADDDENYLDNWDMFGLTLPIKGKGFAITPWFSYSMIGKNTQHAGSQGMYGAVFNGYYFRPEVAANGKAFYQEHAADYETFLMGGVATRWNFADGWNATLDFHYGNVYGKYEEELNREGWTLAGSIDYKFDWAKVGLMGWYSTGDDGDITNGSERMPMANPDWRVTSFGYSGGPLPNGAPGTHIFDYTPAGVWAIGAYAKNISFVDKVSHVFRFLYGRGTNDTDMARYMVGTLPNPNGFSIVNRTRPSGEGNPLYMTTSDYFVEVNFDTTWKPYKNLDVMLDIGYIYLHADEKVWNLDSWNPHAFRIGTSFVYKF